MMMYLVMTILVLMIMMMVMHPIVVRTSIRAQRETPAELECSTIEPSLSLPRCQLSTLSCQLPTVNCSLSTVVINSWSPPQLIEKSE